MKAIPTVKRIEDGERSGWYIGIFDAPRGCNITPEGPFKSMAAAIGRLDWYVSDRGLDNTI